MIDSQRRGLAGMWKTRFLLPLFVCSLALNGGRAFAQPLKTEAQPSVLATTGMIADAAKAIVGDAFRVEALIPPGIDPHLFKASRTDIAKLLIADIIFYNGFFLEGKMEDALQQAARSGKSVVAVADFLPEEFRISAQEATQPAGVDQFDPHIWMDPLAWSSIVEGMKQHLIQKFPMHSKVFEENAQTYLKELAALHEYALQAVGSIPQSSRVLVTAHDAFHYFGKRYGLEVLAIQGLSTASEAGVQDIESLVSVLVERNIGAVFIETTVSERNIKALIEGAAARGHTVKIGGSLYSDAMGAKGSYQGTYVGMIDHNITTIARSLGGTVPANGLRGRLQ